VRSGPGKTAKNKKKIKKKNKKKYSGQQPPTGALVAAGSLWPLERTTQLV
jgi:hypothetical protein